MLTYFSTFVSGLQNIVKKGLKDKLKELEIELMLDGLVVYKTKTKIKNIQYLRFLNNSYLLFKSFNSKKKYSPKNLINKILKHPNYIPNLNNKQLNDFKTFRIMASKENRLVSIKKHLLLDLEILLREKLNLKVDRTSPDTELLFLTRNEGYGFIGLRLTNTSYKRKIHKGELRPELANLMCILADLKSSDVVLDPFAGYGSIPRECIEYFNVKKVIASEKNQKVKNILQNKLKGKKVKIVKSDALALNFLSTDSINKIITDPPWGIYQKINSGLKKFYSKFFTEFKRILKEKGLIILLTAQKESTGELINSDPNLEIIKKYNILVSGKKSSIFKIKKVS